MTSRWIPGTTRTPRWWRRTAIAPSSCTACYPLQRRSGPAAPLTPVWWDMKPSPWRSSTERLINPAVNPVLWTFPLHWWTPLTHVNENRSVTFRILINIIKTFSSNDEWNIQSRNWLFSSFPSVTSFWFGSHIYKSRTQIWWSQCFQLRYMDPGSETD